MSPEWLLDGFLLENFGKVRQCARPTNRFLLNKWHLVVVTCKVVGTLSSVAMMVLKI